MKSTKVLCFLMSVTVLSLILAGCNQMQPAPPANQSMPQQAATAPQQIPSPSSSVHVDASPTGAKVGKISFWRDGTIYVAENPSSVARAVAKGDFPNISPSGKSVAYNRDTTGPNPSRVIEVLDLVTNKVQNFKAFSQYMQYEPLWSPDEKRLAFNILIDDAWQVGVVDLTSGEWKVLTKNLAEKAGVYLGGWTAQSDSITCHSLENIYEVGLNGDMLKKIPVSEVVSEGNISSETNFSLSPDKKLLLYSVDQDPSQKLWEGTGVFVYDLEAKKSRRITKEGREPHWLSGSQEIIYTKFIPTSAKNARRDIYTTNLDGNEQLLMTNGSNGSVSASR